MAALPADSAGYCTSQQLQSDLAGHAGTAARGQNRHLRIDAAARVNTDRAGNTLPVRICVFEISRDDWQPPGLYRNAPCDEAAPDPVMIRQMQHILTPGESRRYSFAIPREATRWLLVAAEFHIPGKNKNTVLINTEVNKNSNVVVVVRERSLTQMKVPVSDKP